MIKILILLWGFVGVLFGAGVSMAHLPGDSFANGTGMFILLVYGSVEVCSLIAFLSSRLAATLLAVSALSAVALVVLSRSLGHSISIPDSWITDIAIRPALSASLFFAISFGEKKRAR